MNQVRPDSTNSLGDIARGLASDVQDLVRGEIALVRTELEDKLQGVIVAAIWLVGGALVGFAGLVIALLGGAAILSRVIPMWAALVVVGAIVLIVGAIVIKSGLAMLARTHLTPDRTAQDLQKVTQMLKEHT